MEADDSRVRGHTSLLAVDLVANNLAGPEILKEVGIGHALLNKRLIAPAHDGAAFANKSLPDVADRVSLENHEARAVHQASVKVSENAEWAGIGGQFIDIAEDHRVQVDEEAGS